MYRKFKPPFFWPAIAQDRQSCQSHFCLMKNPLLYRSAWPESSREASERFLMETLGRTQSKRRRRLALAGGFRLSGVWDFMAELAVLVPAPRADLTRYHG